VADLVHFVRCDNTSYIVIAFSSCRSETNGALSHCRLVIMSLAKHAKRHVVTWRVVAMSPCRAANKSILWFEPSDNVTSQQHIPRQRAVWRASLATGRQDESPTTRRLALCRDVASDTLGCSCFVMCCCFGWFYLHLFFYLFGSSDCILKPTLHLLAKSAKSQIKKS
jgi:hypothetical protein